MNKKTKILKQNTIPTNNSQISSGKKPIFDKGYQRRPNLSRISSGQGTIEYLVIVAVVIVIGLVVVSILTQTTETGGNITAQSTNLKWMQEEIGVMEALGDSNGDIRLAVKNNTFDHVKITKVRVGGITLELDSPVPLNGGKAGTIDFSQDTTCSGKTTTYIIQLIYETKEGLEKHTKEMELIVDCTTNVDTTTSPASGEVVYLSATDGHFPVWNSSIDDWNYSKNISLDTNTMCFTDACDVNITSDGSDIIFNG